jgi:hypothetical protein
MRTQRVATHIPFQEAKATVQQRVEFGSVDDTVPPLPL